MKKISIATGIIENNGKYLIARRLEPERLKGLWEFPGGTIEKNETENETLIREIKEETNLDVKPIKKLDSFTKKVNTLEITMNFIESKILNDEINIKLEEHDQYSWIDKTNWKDYEWTELTYIFAKKLFK